MKRLLYLSLILLLLVTMFSGCTRTPPLEPVYIVQPKSLSVVDYVVDDTVAVVDRFFTYGTHFSVEGTLDVSNYFTADVLKDTKFELSLRYNDKAEDEIVLPLIVASTDTENVISFKTSEYINGGIDLDTLQKKNYLVTIKGIGISQTYYFTLSPLGEDEPGCQPIDYYTLTKKKKNNRINIGFGTCDGTDVPFLALNAMAVRALPDDVYDIVIDPGHGGRDSGAISNDGSIDERKLNLQNAMFIKDKLEAAGFKVYMTRTTAEESEVDTVHNIFDDDGKITKSMETKAKYYLAIHMNSGTTKNTDSGYEIYIAPLDDVALARSFSKAIGAATGRSPSTLGPFKVEDGVYKRGFKDTDLLDLQKTASDGGFKMYENVSVTTPYYYFIREVGGIVTGAYSDGRNKLYSAGNKYMTTNQGIESYLFELAYINNDDDLSFALLNGEMYATGITNGLINFLNPEK